MTRELFYVRGVARGQYLVFFTMAVFVEICVGWGELDLFAGDGDANTAIRWKRWEGVTYSRLDFCQGHRISDLNCTGDVDVSEIEKC